MIAIGLIGAPGAGKTALANALKDEMSDLWIIDGYSDFLKEHDRVLGELADYDTNLWLYFQRYGAEQHHRQFDESFVSVGTTVDNLAHASCVAEAVANGVQTPKRNEHLARAMKATETLACLLLDRFEYHHLYYLPLAPESDLFTTKVDTAIQEVFSRFALRSVPELRGTLEENTQKVMEDVAAFDRRGAS